MSVVARGLGSGLRVVAPSILSADFTRLGEQVAMLNGSEAAWVHLDIMDGVFVPNISFGFPLVSAVRGLTDKVLDAHLMIVQPERYLARFAELGVEYLTVHYEASTHLHRTLQQIRDLGMKAGVALNPHTPPEVLRDVLWETDMVLVMSVNPGFGGQRYISSATDRIARLAGMIAERGCGTLIQVDGGIGVANARQVWDAGAHVIVAGNAVFGAPDPAAAIRGILYA